MSTLAELRTRLGESPLPAHVRVLLRRTDSGWVVHYVWAMVGPEPPAWVTQTWRYEQLAFVACVLPAPSLAALFSGDGGSVALDGMTASVPAAHDQLQWSRQPSFGRYGQPAMPVPTCDFPLSPIDSNAPARQLPHDMLVGVGCPSFAGPDQAWRAFFEDDFSLTGTSGTRQELGLIRIAAIDAWLGRVHISATTLSVDIHGEQVKACRLELFGKTGRSERVLHTSGLTTIPLDEGLPEDAWLWLKRGNQWLDYRAFSPQWTPPDVLARSQVEFEAPVEPLSAVEALLAAGEGPYVEYKSSLPDQSPGAKRKVFKTVAAFAMGQGGTMVFGVDPDETTVLGLGDEDPRELRDRLGHLIRAVVMPTPDFTVNDYLVDGQMILVLTVQPGASPPYGIAVDPGTRNKPEYYVRRGASTYPALPSDLREATLG
jgi:hypothetical protein